MNSKLVAATSLKSMFQKDKWFDITRFKDCAKIMGVTVPAEIETQLHALHCVHWSEMLPELRQEVYDTVVELMKSGTEEFSFDILLEKEVIEEPKKKGGLLTFLGRKS